MAGDSNDKDKDLESEVLYDYGEKLGSIEVINISETFEEPLLLAAGCFHPNTPIVMKDGSTKEIKNLLLGDELYQGGKVYMKMEALTNDMYEIAGVRVAGNHTVYENGKWIEVCDSERAIRQEGTHIIVNIGTDKHMVVTESGLIFSDYFVTDKHVEIDRQLVGLINEEKDENFMRKTFDLA